MTSRQIQTFLTVAETLNFTETAERLYSSQPSISRNISLLEEELGFKLFERGNNFVTLTQAGTIMAQTFTDIRELYQKQHKIASYLAQGISGKLTLGFHSNLNISQLCLEYLDRFHKEHPYVVIDFSCHSNAELNRLFAEKQIDVAITHEFNRPNTPNSRTKPFYQTNMFLLYGKRHPNYGKKDLCFQDFASSRFYCPEECDSDVFWELMEKLTRYYQVAPWKIHTANNIETVLLNIKFGNGVSFLDDVILEHIGEDLCVLPLDKSISEVNLNITWDKRNPNPMIPLLVSFF